MAQSHDDAIVARSEVMTLHWEGPPRAEVPEEPAFPGSDVERREARERERERELREVQRTQQGQAIWGQIEKEAKRRGDAKVWERKLHAYAWVKMAARGTAADYARRYEVNHATVRWRLHRARAIFKETWESRYGAGDGP